jgi:hypothetical protein
LDDYQNLPAETLADLAERAARIKAALQRGVIEIGHELTEAKKHLTHGQFAAWVKRETGLSIRMAQHLMRAHALCLKNENFSLLSRSALFALSAAPIAAVTAVKEKIAAGDLPRYTEVREIVKAKRKPSPRPTTQVQIAKAEAKKAEAEAVARMFAPETKRIPTKESRHPDGFVVRLHNLGDFYSVEYVELWGKLLERHPGLHVWGYTAHTDGPIFAALVELVKRYAGRFAIRFSNAPFRFPYPATITVESAAQIPADAILCPEQIGKTESCSTCGLCWHTDKANCAMLPRIAFIQHWKSFI